MNMDEKSRRNMEELELSGIITGVGRITRGECPIGCVTPIACMLCSNGHLLECHYPMDCSTAKCSHLQREREIDPEY